MSDIEVSLDSKKVVDGTKKAITALDSLIAAMERLQKESGASGSKMDEAWDKSLKAMETANGKLKRLFEARKKSAEEGTSEFPNLLRAEAVAINKVLEDKIAMEVAMNNQELATFKAHGGRLSALQKLQLKQFETDNKNRAASATPMSLDDTRKLLGMPSMAEAKAASDAIKDQMTANQKQLVATSKAIAASATPMNLDDTRKLLGMPSRDEMKGFAAQLKSQMSSDLTKERWKVASATSVNLDDTRALLGLPSRSEMSSFAKQLKTEMTELQRAQSAATKAQIPLTSVGGLFTPYDALAVKTRELREQAKNLKNGSDELGNSFKRLAVDGNDVHSMARGLASGFNALWLTWGNLAPLFIGAAISNGFMQTVKSGMAVADTLKTIEVLGGNTSSEMSLLKDELLAISRSGPAGPLQVAEAMKTLSLAGMKANEIIGVTRTVLNFSVAGNVGIEKAAQTLMAVTTAFGMGAEGFQQVADVITKASAVSMTSVEQFSEAMKTASVINSQYGVSLNDTAVAIAAMSQLNIQGTAAGTALRNMYADLSGRTAQVAKVMRMQGIAAFDSAGNFKPLIGVVSALNDKLNSMKTEADRRNLLQAILSERGAKGMVELLRLIQTEATKTGTTTTSMFEELQTKISDNAGFSNIAAAQMNQTAKKQFEAVKATLEASMVEVYQSVDPTLILIADRLKAVFNSEEFKTALNTLVTGVATFTTVLLEHIKTLTFAATAYVVLKTAQVATVTVYGLAAAASVLFKTNINAETAAIALNTEAKVVNAAVSAGFAARLGLVARAIPGVGTAIAIATAAYMAYDVAMSDSSKSMQDSSIIYSNSVAKDLNDQADKLEAILKLRKEGMTLQAAEAKLANEKTLAKPKSELQELEAQLQASKALYVADSEYVKGIQRKIDAKRSEIKVSEDAVKAASDRVASAVAETNAFNSLQIKPPKPVGTQTFDARDMTSSGEALFGTLKTLRVENAGLNAEFMAGTSITSEWTNIQKTAARELETVKDQYAKATASIKDLSEKQKTKIDKDKAEAVKLVETNSQLRISILNRKELTDILNKQADAQAALNNSAETYALEQSTKYSPAAYKQAAMATLKIDQKYREDVRNLDTKYQGKLDEAGGDPLRQVSILAQRRQELDNLAKNKTTQTAQDTAKIYQDAWDNTISGIANDFSSQLMKGTLDVKDFMVQTFASTVLMPQLQMLTSRAFSSLLGGAGGWFSGLAGTKSFDGGGYTGTGPRAGGMDGKGGFLAMVHPNETVVDHTKGQSAGSGPVYITISNTVGDVATKSMLDQANAATVKQIQAGMSRSMRYNGVMSRG